MIRVFVGDEDGVEGACLDAELLQGGLKPGALEARIEHHARAARF